MAGVMTAAPVQSILCVLWALTARTAAFATLFPRLRPSRLPVRQRLLPPHSLLRHRRRRQARRAHRRPPRTPLTSGISTVSIPPLEAAGQMVVIQAQIMRQLPTGLTSRGLATQRHHMAQDHTGTTPRQEGPDTPPGMLWAVPLACASISTTSSDVQSSSHLDPHGRSWPLSAFASLRPQVLVC